MDVSIRRYHGREALRTIGGHLRDAGFADAPIPGMDPDFLAEGVEGDHPGAIIAYRGATAIGYLCYAFQLKTFPLKIGGRALAYLPYRQLRIFGFTALENGSQLAELLLRPLLNDRTWHVAEVFEAPPDNPLAQCLIRRVEESGYRLIHKEIPTIQVQLEDNFESYLMKRFTKKTRYNLKREVRLLEEETAGEVELRIFQSPADMNTFMSDAERVAKLTYQWKLGMNTLRATPLVMKRTSYLARSGKWRSYILYIRGEPAAYCYATIRRGELSYDIVGYDPKYAALNAGKVLLFKMLQELHDSRVVAALDFGPGLADYKLLFANSRRSVLDLSLFCRKPYSHLLFALASIADIGYRSMRPLLRQAMLYIKRRARKVAGAIIPALMDEAQEMTQIAILLTTP